MTIALIAHNDMKKKIKDFAIQYEDELAMFHRIITTGTTGKMIGTALPSLNPKIELRQSGPEGGDIEIACDILRGECHVVVFFVDPLNPHPHIDDIRVVFGACMIQKEVRMLTNEIHAREWFETVIRGR